MSEYLELMKSAGCGSVAPMAMTRETASAIKNAPDRVPAMFRSLSVGDDDSFVKQAASLGFSIDQARHAVRDTAALAAIIMQAGADASW